MTYGYGGDKHHRKNMVRKKAVWNTSKGKGGVAYFIRLSSQKQER